MTLASIAPLWGILSLGLFFLAAGFLMGYFMARGGK